jgi:LPS export ABC transporter protein LptC
MISPLRKYYFSKTARMLIPGVLFFAITACKNNPDDIRALTEKTGKQEDRAQDVTIINSKDGKIKMRAFAREFVRNESAKPAYIDMNGDLKAEFYDDSGKVANTLTADSSRYYENEGNLIVWDSVKIVSKKGETLNTSELIWNESIHKFFTEKPVRITTATEVMYGNGMEANSDFTQYQIMHPNGTVQVNKGEVPQ